MEKDELIIVIPAYEPNNLLVDLIQKLNQYFSDVKILVVNDGSSTNSLNIFNTIGKYDNVIVINHLENKGKGASLKTAFKYIMDMDENYHIIVTADADGQHKPEDIFKVVSYYEQIKIGVVLGSRTFQNKVPLRSRFGNDVTKFLYRLFNRKALNDNQTGLRAFGSELLPFMLSVEGDRYEYEMNMLMECARQEIILNEVKISTVYINNNESSHFRPVRDFLKICKNIFKYSIVAIITLLIDIIVFLIMINILKESNIEGYLKLLISCFVSFSVSILINYILNSFGILYGNKYIFKNKKTRFKYMMLSFASLLVNTLTVLGMFFLIKDLENAKIFGETNFIAIALIGNYILAPKAKFK